MPRPTIAVAYCNDCDWTFPQIRRQRWTDRDVAGQSTEHSTDYGHSTHMAHVVPDDRPVRAVKPSSGREKPFTAQCAGHPIRDATGASTGAPYYPIYFDDRHLFEAHVHSHPEHKPPRLTVPKITQLKAHLVPSRKAWKPKPFAPGTRVTWIDRHGERQFGQVWSLERRNGYRWVIPVTPDGRSLPARSIAVADMQPTSAYAADAQLTLELSA